MPEDTIFEQGSKGDEVYLVLRGLVSMQVMDEDVYIAPQSPVPMKPGDTSKFKIKRRGTLKVIKHKNKSRLTFHRVCRPGDVFGEAAITNSEAKRESTAVAMTPVMLICFKASNFNRIGAGAKADFTFEEKLSFLRTLPLFTSWPFDKICALSLLCQTKEHYKGDVISVKGTESPCFSVIYSGKARLEIAGDVLSQANKMSSAKVVMVEQGEYLGESGLLKEFTGNHTGYRELSSAFIESAKLVCLTLSNKHYRIFDNKTVDKIRQNFDARRAWRGQGKDEEEAEAKKARALLAKQRPQSIFMPMFQRPHSIKVSPAHHGTQSNCSHRTF